MPGLIKGSGGGVFVSPGGGIVAASRVRAILPTSVSMLTTASAGQKIADLTFVEFADSQASNASVTLVNDADGRVALAGSWATGFSLVVGVAAIGSAADYTLTIQVGGVFGTFAISLSVITASAAVTLFTASLENADSVQTWANQEISFGQWFAPGDVPAGSIVIALVDSAQIPLQASNRLFWNDGSLKHAQMRALIPPRISAGGTKTITWRRIPGFWSAHDQDNHPSPVSVTNVANIEYRFPSWKGRSTTNVLTNERGPKVFSTNNMLASDNMPWVEKIMGGPVCTEWRVSDMSALASGSTAGEFTSEFSSEFTVTKPAKDPNFGALLYVRAWGGTPGQPKRLQFLFRTVQGWSTDVPADEQGIQVDIDLAVNGTVVRGHSIGTAGWSSVRSWKGGFLVSAGTTGAMDWYDVDTDSFVTPPNLVYRHNVTYGIQAKYLPPIDVNNPSMPMTAGATSYLPGKRGPLRAVQDDVAEHHMIAWTTSKPMVWSMAAHARATAAQVLGHQQYARAAAFGMGAMHSVALHRTTRKIISYIPPEKQSNESTLGASIYGNGKVAQPDAAYRTEITGLDSAHFPQMAYWPALSEGDQHFVDLAYHEVTLPGLFEDPNYGFHGSATVNGVTKRFGGISYRGQIRGNTHSVRPIGNALAIGNPADPHWIMTRDYLDHWAEMTVNVTLEQDDWRGGLTRTDGRRFQDLKLLWPNNEPTYKLWMHTIGLGAMAYNAGVSEYPKMKEMAEWFAYAPTVLSGGYHNDDNYLMKPDPMEGVGYQQLCMDGISSNSERRRYWLFGQWSGLITNCTYKADGQTIEFSTAPYGYTSMQNGMIITASALRGGEPHWVSDATKVPGGLTLGNVYYSVQSSGLTCKIAATRNGSPVTFTTPSAVDLVGHIFRRGVGGIHTLKPGSEASGAGNAYLTQIAASLDMVKHYVKPDDPRLDLARHHLYRIKNGTSTPNEWDERAKTVVPVVKPWLSTGGGASGSFVVANNYASLSITSTGVPVVAQREYTVTPGQLYTLSFTSSIDIRTAINSTQMSGELINGMGNLGVATNSNGAQTRTFTPTGNSVWIAFQRYTAATVTVSGISLTP